MTARDWYTLVMLIGAFALVGITGEQDWIALVYIWCLTIWIFPKQLGD